MNRSELQKALKPFKEVGLVTIKLTSKTEELQKEFDRVGSCPIGFTPIPEPTVTEVPETEDEILETEQPLVDSESIVCVERYLFEVGLKIINHRWLKFLDPKLQDYSVHIVPGEPGFILVAHDFYGEIYKIHIYGQQLLVVLSSVRNYVSDFQKLTTEQVINHKRNELEKLLNMPA